MPRSALGDGCAALAIANRTAAKATSLACRVEAAFPVVRVRVGDRYDLAINATSLGMNAPDPLPMSRDVIARSALVAECVLAPKTTRLLEIARESGQIAYLAPERRRACGDEGTCPASSAIR